ncbi:hypothetical protein EXIGLDRAFT_769686 [Exidia glandulosa HHB12029]|uniref:Secreted protein n=1 Tax=Exidia glandulosa HHB12029 TaxID=1314781 RepID=A0A165H9D3_EXIGL|nr:hypothetical protein EXIGLDRAFT_769686 [Exidia glandulosa HHB12029]
MNAKKNVFITALNVVVAALHVHKMYSARPLKRHEREVERVSQHAFVHFDLLGDRMHAKKNVFITALNIVRVLIQRPTYKLRLHLPYNLRRQARPTYDAKSNVFVEKGSTSRLVSTLRYIRRFDPRPTPSTA